MPVTDEAIVLVGGFGTRLRSVVSDVPKPLAPIRGRPFLAYLLDLLSRQGVKKVVLATGYMGDIVAKSMGERWEGMWLRYSHEKEPLGTGGAIAKAAAQIDGDTFFAINGDTYVHLNYPAFDAFVAQNQSSLGMALAHVPDVARYGAVKLVDERVVGFTEKGIAGPGYINAGVYRVDRKLMDALPPKNNFSFETEVLVPSVGQHRVAGYTDTRQFIDIGVPEDYRRAQDELCTEKGSANGS
jgi:D-glycero-alpha-D-manno-heptose 1-phosphate guanylyltransferase